MQSSATASQGNRKSRNHQRFNNPGWYVIIVERTWNVYRDVQDDDEMVLNIYRRKKVGTESETFTVNVTAQEMGRLWEGQEVSICRGGIFSKKYYLKGNPNCSFFCSTITGIITSK